MKEEVLSGFILVFVKITLYTYMLFTYYNVFVCSLQATCSTSRFITSSCGSHPSLSLQSGVSVVNISKGVYIMTPSKQWRTYHWEGWGG